MTYTQLQLHKFGNKAGKLLARLSKGMYLPTHITALHNPDGIFSTSPKDITRTLETFYANLYAQEPIDPCKVAKWLQLSPLPRITPDLLMTLISPITEEEILASIKGLASHKAPGPDGYTSEFFKLLKEEITPSLFLVYYKIWDVVLTSQQDTKQT